MSTTGFRRGLLVDCDLCGYGAVAHQRQRVLQELLVRSLDRAASDVGLDRGSWLRQPKGDEEFAVLPPDAPEPLVVDSYVRKLNAELRSVNRDLLPEARLRMRLAMHHGTVVPGANGIPGPDAVLVNRLLNCSAARQALEHNPSACLVLIISEHLYETLVEPGYTTWDEHDFHLVHVREKSFRGNGWLWVPPEPTTPIPFQGGPAPVNGARFSQHYRGAGEIW